MTSSCLRRAALGAGFTAALFFTRSAAATWSIAATDATTKQVGGSSASCTAPTSLYVIYGSSPGHGVIMAQARWNTAGRDKGISMLAADTDPTEIIATITASSFDPSASQRQYGVADLLARHAGFTGTSTTAYNEHRGGTDGAFNYAIQGNILTSVKVLDQSEAAFKEVGCDLADRLMRALEGGAKSGEGDNRCTPKGTPASSAFLEVDEPTGAAGSFLRLRFTDTSTGRKNAVAEVRTQFDDWRKTHPCPTPPALDAGVDAATSDAASDASATLDALAPGVDAGDDAGTPTDTTADAAGCGCRTSRPDPAGSWATIALGVVLVRRLRTRTARRS